ncbi:unnamed protein product [Microthlaspi erraticum]|uniref:ferredoxin--NADP(+) reductase n=1 Tax=Microthlaspi erraticum TaxID=1685480 RepID=A0A6D2JUQ2_9BRAS|nr:unnamed protein product [Microthlaspi erraticum]
MVIFLSIEPKNNKHRGFKTVHELNNMHVGSANNQDRLRGASRWRKRPRRNLPYVIYHDGNLPYWEGQSYGVIPPGENPKKPGAPHNVRLYSIASSGMEISLTVRQRVCVCEDPSKNSVCSNFLCDSKPGDKIQISGPSGKVMLLPEDDPNATHIMIATGTGVAPYRGYLRRMFMENVPNYKFGGLAWLFLGVANTDSLLFSRTMSLAST